MQKIWKLINSRQLLNWKEKGAVFLAHFQYSVHRLGMASEGIWSGAYIAWRSGPSPQRSSGAEPMHCQFVRRSGAENLSAFGCPTKATKKFAELTIFGKLYLIQYRCICVKTRVAAYVSPSKRTKVLLASVVGSNECLCHCDEIHGIDSVFVPVLQHYIHCSVFSGLSLPYSVYVFLTNYVHVQL